MMDFSDLRSAASALYDGGWRAGDGDELLHEYGICSPDLDMIVELLTSFEVDATK